MNAHAFPPEPSVRFGSGDGRPHRAVLLDAGHTLVFIDRDRVREIYGRIGLAWDRKRFETAELAAREQLSRRVEAGHQGTEPSLWKEYFATLFRRSDVPAETVDRVGHVLREEHRKLHLWTHVEEGTPEALEHLRERGYRVAVISNADGRMEDALTRAGLRDRVEFVLDSEVVGIAKPDPRIFREGARRLGLLPEECLYVGDLYPVDVVGARRAGMGAVLVEPGGWTKRPVPRIAAVRELPSLLLDGEEAPPVEGG